MSFSFDYDINASQQDPNHDDSGIGLLDGLPQLPMGAH
jgi:regulatory factor X